MKSLQDDFISSLGRSLHSLIPLNARTLQTPSHPVANIHPGPPVTRRRTAPPQPLIGLLPAAAPDSKSDPNS